MGIGAGGEQCLDTKSDGFQVQFLVFWKGAALGFTFQWVSFFIFYFLFFIFYF
jgi:hypothetical protein